MSLSEYKVAAAIAVSDMDRARKFYAGKLGHSSDTDHAPDDNRAYRRGVALHREWMIQALTDEVEGVGRHAPFAVHAPDRHAEVSSIGTPDLFVLGLL